MTKKAAIIYKDHKGPPVCHYSSNNGEVWMSNHKLNHFNNIGMNWYSLRNPEPNDYFMVLEPYCVNDVDYNMEFLKKFKKIFTWASKPFENTIVSNKIVQINHPSCKDHSTANEIKNNLINWKNKKNEIVIIANNKKSKHFSELYSLRTALTDFFHNKSKFEVSWYGQSKIKKPYYKGAIDNKKDILKHAKFSICSENCYDEIYSHGYFTEKMPDVWFSGCVPLYMGCYNIDDFSFPQESYIDLRKFVSKNKKSLNIKFEDLLQTLESFSELNYNETIQSILNNMESKNGLLHHISYNRMYEIILQNIE